TPLPSPSLPMITTLFPYTTLFRSALHGLYLTPATPRANSSPGRQTNSLSLSPFGTRAYTDSSCDMLTHTPADEFVVEGMSQDERSEEHTSELQSRSDIVCRLLLEK